MARERSGLPGSPTGKVERRETPRLSPRFACASFGSAGKMSMAATLPRQQEEAQSPPQALAPPPPHATRGTRWQQSAGSAMARKLEPNASKGAAPPLRSLSQVARSSSAAAARGGAGPGGLYRAALASSASAGTMPRVAGSAAAGQRRAAPGSAAASASQVEALLARLEELETHVSEAAKSEEELKAINLALMERLAAFQRANDENVEAAERGSNRHPQPLPCPRPRPRPHLCPPSHPHGHLTVTSRSPSPSPLPAPSPGGRAGAR